MKSQNFLNVIFVALLSTYLFGCKPTIEPELTLKDAYAGKFLIGAALNVAQSSGFDTAALRVVETQFNTITAENCMKNEVIHPSKELYDFAKSDSFVNFGVKNNMFIVGHTLVWHAQTAPWFFYDDLGNKVSRDTLISRMKSHIYTVVGRYKGKVKGWDVVNEAISDKPGDGLRKSLWYEIIGPDFIELAFKFAHEADPEAELYYNDYNLFQSFKRDEAVKIVNNLKAKGLRIDAIGEQGHYGIDFNLMVQIEESLKAFIAAGVNVSISELDISVLPFPSETITAEVSQSYQNKPEYDPFRNGLPYAIQEGQTAMYKGLFYLFLKYHKHIDRITFWGVNDSQSWRNYWPIKDRIDYPLFVGRDNKFKSVFYDVIELSKQK